MLKIKASCSSKGKDQFTLKYSPEQLNGKNISHYLKYQSVDFDTKTELASCALDGFSYDKK